MTKKRYQKLLRAYLTRLNEWAKEHDPDHVVNMGRVYKSISTNKSPVGLTRAEGWAKLEGMTNTFGVGKKAK